MYNTKTMDMKSLYLNSFIDQVFQFLDDILVLVPNDTDVLAAQTYLSALKRGNPKLIITSWYQCVTVKYRAEVEKGNFDFALNKNYNDDIATFYKNDSENQKYFSAIVEKVRNIASDLSEDNKKKVIKYFQNLSNLSMLYCA